MDLTKILTFRRMAAIVLIVELIVVFTPIGLPIAISPPTQDFYDVIVEEAGGTAIYGAEYITYGTYWLKRDMKRAVFKHLADNDIKLVLYSLGPQSPQVVAASVEYAKLEEDYGYVYGVDYVIFPYLAGEESALAAIAADMHVMATDIYGTPTADLPLMQDLHVITDCDFAIIECSAFTFGEMFVRQSPGKYGITTIGTIYYSAIAAYYGTLIVGDLEVPRGYAEFEYMTGYTGMDVSMMDVRNVMASIIIITTIVMNINLLYERGKRPAGV
jgi:hypothetical protein